MKEVRKLRSSSRGNRVSKLSIAELSLRGWDRATNYDKARCSVMCSSLFFECPYTSGYRHNCIHKYGSDSASNSPPVYIFILLTEALFDISLAYFFLLSYNSIAFSINDGDFWSPEYVVTVPTVLVNNHPPSIDVVANSQVKRILSIDVASFFYPIRKAVRGTRPSRRCVCQRHYHRCRSSGSILYARSHGILKQAQYRAYLPHCFSLHADLGLWQL